MSEEATDIAVLAADDEDEFTLPAISDDRPRWTPPAKPEKGAGSQALPYDVNNMFIQQAVAALPDRGAGLERRHPGLDADREQSATIKMMEAFNPQDATEGVLVAQIVIMHNLAAENARRVSSRFTSGPELDAAMNRAAKASRLAREAIESLSKYRGKGRQTMIVEHVHVHQGGQAIVGQVGGTVSEAGGSTKNRG